ncbi:hypothetical protein TNCV_3822721 [Trichonephila clavipes]|nr:hypothetical protein TNCV_3822721 [Trichonephila clavipes]
METPFWGRLTHSLSRPVRKAFYSFAFLILGQASPSKTQIPPPPPQTISPFFRALSPLARSLFPVSSRLPEKEPF